MVLQSVTPFSYLQIAFSQGVKSSNLTAWHHKTKKLRTKIIFPILKNIRKSGHYNETCFEVFYKQIRLCVTSFFSSEARKNYILSQLYLVRYTQISKVWITIKVWIPIRLFIISLKAKVTVSE